MTDFVNVKLKDKTVLRVGTYCLPGYTLKEVLGSGRYGVVHAACDVKAKCTYAVKIQLLRQKMDVREFAIEVAFTKAASDRGYGPRLVLEHTCPAQCASVVPGGACQTIPPEFAGKHELPLLGIIVMEKYAHTYIDMVQPRPYRGLMARIVAMHKTGVVHSDLLAKNVMVSADKKVVKLIDWGLSFTVHKPYSPLSWERRRTMFADWFDTAITKYMARHFPRFFKQNAWDVLEAIVQWGMLLKLDYRKLLARPKRNETVYAYAKKHLRQPKKASYLMIVDWALPYTEWMRHGGRKVSVHLSEATSGKPGGLNLRLFINENASVMHLKQRLNRILQISHRFKKPIEKLTLNGGGRVLQDNATLVSMPYREGKDVLVALLERTVPLPTTPTVEVMEEVDL